METWTEEEVELIVSDYFEMLHKEISGLDYVKADHRKRIAPLLKNRSNGSIEFKHQNISAVLISLGLPYISGYKPRGNFQQLLAEIVGKRIKQDDSLELKISQFAESNLITRKTVDFNKWLSDPPSKNIVSEPTYAPRPVKINYLELEQRNHSTGQEGERLVLEYERWRLRNISSKKADQVVWISKEEGDGAGYDILSYDNNGDKMFIEVKSTKLGKETPIYFSSGENEFSERNHERYNLYRVFNMNKQPKMFNCQGRFRDFCEMQPVNFRGYF